jgi:hypothetical protein
MRALHRISARAAAASLLIIAAAVPAHAQLANASTAATGLSGAFTARATGYNAVAWNPANLAMPGNPGFSFTLLALDGGAGLRPIDLNKLAPYSKTNKVPQSVREQWMLDVIADSGEKGDIGGGLTELGLSIGSFALQVNTKVASRSNLSPGVVEGILFGNVGRTNTIDSLHFLGSSLEGAAYTTVGASYAIPLTSLIPLTNFAVGATVKYTVGHGIISALDNGSAIDSNANVNFPGVFSNGDSISGGTGKGIGLDLGGAWTIPGFRFGVSLQNVINTFKWDTTKMVSRSALGLFRADTVNFGADTTDQPYSSAPAALRAKIAAQRFKPVIAAGVAFDWIPSMTISADVRQQVGDGIEVGPKSLVATGVEWRLIPFIPLRGGLSVMTGGYGVSGGFGVHLLGFEAGVAGYLRKRNGGSEPGMTVNLISIRP